MPPPYGPNRGAGRTLKQVVELVGDMSSSSAAVCSAEGAVDDDFSQSGLEDGEFVVVELLDEQLRHTAKMDRHGFGQTCDTRISQGDDHAAPVVTSVCSSYEALLNQPRDAAGQPGP
jgi:hypothetical protein